MILMTTSPLNSKALLRGSVLDNLDLNDLLKKIVCHYFYSIFKMRDSNAIGHTLLSHLCSYAVPKKLECFVKCK